MGVLAGIVRFDGALDNQAEQALCAAIAIIPAGRTATRHMQGALFAHRSSRQVDRPPRDLQPSTARGGGALFAASARLDNREELGGALNMAPAELASVCDADLILRMLERRGDAGVAQCLGAFAFALWDAEAKRLTLGRDCLGNKSLFYYCGRGFAAFATNLGVLLALPAVPRELDEIALANFLAFNLAEGRRTFYRDIDRVPGGMLATMNRGGAHHRQYWSLNFDAPPPYMRHEDYIERARELFDQAVAAAIRDTPRVAISASGGLDSSAVAATAARLGTAKSITCFTLLPPPGTNVDVGKFKYRDERDKVEALARMHPALNLHWVVPTELHPVEKDCTQFFALANTPIMGPTAYGSFAHIRDAVLATGHRVLLLGSLGNFGLSWWGRLAIAALFRAGRWGEFAHELRRAAKDSDRSMARTFAGEVLMPNVPLGLGRLINRLRGRNSGSVAHHSALNPSFIAEHGLARQWRAQGFDPWFSVRGWNSVRHRAGCLFEYHQVARDLAGMAEEVDGYEVRDPHGDRRLLEFLLSVPEPMYRRDGVARAFAREVLADRLPREIINETRRGAQVNDWFQRLQARRQEIAADIAHIDSSELARRLIDVPRLKRLMAEWPADEHAAQKRMYEYMLALPRGVNMAQFIRWVEGGNT